MVAVALPPNPANKTLRLELTQHYLSEYSELERILLANMFAVQKNQYSLEILLTIARLCKQNLQMIVHISEIEKLLVAAADSASEAKPAEAVAALDSCLDEATAISREQQSAFVDAVRSWQKSWHPRVLEANGRRCVASNRYGVVTFGPFADTSRESTMSRIISLFAQWAWST